MLRSIASQMQRTTERNDFAMTKKKPLFLDDFRDSKTLMQVALGQDTADLAVVNATLANVYTGELIEGSTISIKDKWIAYVGQNQQHTIGSKTKVIDAEGKTVIPGFIDGHTHLAWLSTADSFLEHAMKGGTTTIVTEFLEPYFVVGYEGSLDFLDSLKNQPIKILATAPAAASISQASRGISDEALKKLLKRNDIFGMGESYWQTVLQEPDKILPLFEQTLQAGKTLEGHTAGASDKKLSAYIASGITSCHEPINADQVVDRLRLGLHIMVREGAIRKDLEEISKIKDRKIDLRRLILASDSISPQDLMENGYMESLVQKAIDCEIEPMQAVQMTTLNVAEHFAIDNFLGGIAPGRYADLVIIPDINTIDAEMVISNGQIIAQNGTLLIPPRKHTFSKESLNTIHLPRKVEPSDFIIPVPGNIENVQIRVIKMITDLVTSEEALDWPVVDGQLKPDLEKDTAKIAAIDRTHEPGKLFVGLIQGFGLQSGAMASSAAWDTSDIVVIGANDADMAFAVNRIHEMQGGTVVCDNEQIVSELPLPIFGLVSNLSLESIDRKFQDVSKAAKDLGVSFPQPMLSLITLTGAAVPYLRICEEGLVNLKSGATLSLFIE